MTPQFSQGKAAIKRPPWCIKPTKDRPAAYVDGRPTGLTAVCYWTDIAIPVDIAESFRLYYDGLLPGWTGQSGHEALNLKLSIVILPQEDSYDFLLELRNDLFHLDDDSWHDAYVPPGPPWNSGQMEHRYPPGDDGNGVLVLD